MEDFAVLIARSQEGDKRAREELTERNLGLVHTIAGRFMGRGVEAEDLFQIGTIGLLKAIDKFDLSYDVKFSTYAVPMIMGEIKRFLRDDGMVKVSRTIKENSAKVKSVARDLRERLGREPTWTELEGECGLSHEDLLLAMESDHQVESLQASISGEDGKEVLLVDRMAVSKDGTPIKNASDEEKESLLDHMFLMQLLEGLEARERQLIILRYYENKTQNEVAPVLGISQVQVSRMEKKILLRMRHMARV